VKYIYNPSIQPPVLRRLTQVDYEFKANLGYKASSKVEDMNRKWTAAC
jgi:hypothetical protein